MVVNTTDQIYKDNLCRILQEELQKEKTQDKGESSSMVSQGIATTTPQEIEGFIKNFLQNKSSLCNHLQVKFEAPLVSYEPSRKNTLRKRDQDVHPDAEAPP
ncbi:hypothetical protein Tco_0768182 [Tanacetum coccineum]